jgi:Trypsin-like peptidase domain
VTAGAVARLWNGEDVVGGGFRVGPHVVATCAHVVAEAVGADPYSDVPPAGEVSLDFPLAPDGEHPPPRLAAVVRHWSPIAPDGGGDIALLEVTEPLPGGTTVPPMRRIDRLWDHGFRVLGFPHGAPAGVWSTGLIRGEQGTRWFQLQSRPGEQRVEGGFSGCPVWHEESGAVVGMTVAADRGATTAAYLIPIDQVLGLDPGLVPCPYRGLRPFGEEQAGVFFGREAEIGRLADAVARNAVVAVAGPSGAGKSSLVRAGLLPRLRASGTPVVDLRADPASGPASRLEGCPPGSVVVIDQFEELAAVDPGGARDVLDQVLRVTEGGAARAVITVRWAALDEIAGPELMGVLERGTVLVGPMGRSELRDAIVGPAERSPGLAFEPGLVDRILDDAGAEPGRLPLVQSLLTDLWDQREGGRLTLRGYEAAGGVAGAVAQRAERAVEAVAPEASEDLRRLFIALARPDRDGRFVRRAVPLEQLPPEQRALVAALADARLVVVGPSAAGPTVVEQSHQALIDHWPRLRAWLDEDRAFLTWQAQVDGQRERWEAEDRAHSVLLRGAPLAEAADWLPTREADLAPADADFVRRSQARQRWEVRRWRIVAAVVAVLGLVAASLSVVAVQRQDTLAGQLATATAGALARESLNRLSTDSAFAARLALAAWHADPAHPDARSALGASYLALQSADRELASVGPVAVSELAVAGDVAVAAGPSRPLVLAGVPGPSPRHEELPVAERSALALSRAGQWLAEVPPDGSAIRLRDLTAPGEPRTLPSPGGSVSYPQFSADGTRLMWAVTDAAGVVTLTVWDLRSDIAVPHGLGAIPKGTLNAWLTPDPDLILVSTGDQTTTTTSGSRLALRSLTDGSEVAVMPAGSTVVGGGWAIASCATSGTGDAVTAVTPVGAVSPSLQVRMLDFTCNSWLSADGGSLIETDSLGARGGSPVRITDLRSGAAHYAVLPPGVLDGRADEQFTAALDVAVTRTSGTSEPPTVLVAAGGTVYRLTTRPGFVGGEQIDAPTQRSLAADDGSFVLGHVGATLVVDDKRTGHQVSRLPGVVAEGSKLAYGESDIWVASPEPSAWRLTRYAVPDLRRITSFLLPVSAEPAPTSPEPYEGQDSAIEYVDAPDGERILSLSDGVLAVLDPGSGRPLHPPVTLGDSPQERRWYKRVPMMQARPGHPGHAVVIGNEGELEVWDAVHGVRTATIPTTHSPVDELWVGGLTRWIAMDASGSRLAVLTPDHTIEVWDVDTAALLGPPIPAPGAVELPGFDADGHLVVLADETSSERVLRFIDLDERRETGSLVTGTTVTRGVIGPEGRAMWYFASRESSPYLVPLTAGTWRDKLCSMLDRPFTEPESRILPPGADSGRPCS